MGMGQGNERAWGQWGRSLRWLGWVGCGLVLGTVSFAAFPAIAQGPAPAPLATPAAAPEFEQARQAYEVGRFTEAIDHWQRAAQQAAQRDDRAAQGAAWHGISLAWGQLGDRAAALKAVQQSLALLAALRGEGVVRLRAAALNQQARLELTAGQAARAIQLLEQAESLYRSAGDRDGQLGASLNRAQALQALGLYGRALMVIEGQIGTAPEAPREPTRLQGLGLLSAGEALRSLGQLARAETWLSQAATVLEQSGTLADRSTAALALARTRALLARQGLDRNDPQWMALRQQAMASFDRARVAAAAAGSDRDRLWGQLERWEMVFLGLETGSSPGETVSKAQLQALATQVAQLPIGRDRIAAQMRLARWWSTVNEPALALAGLQQAAQAAQALGDHRLTAAVWGQLGETYRQRGETALAARWLEQSLALVEGLAAPEVTYRTARSLGQLRAQGGDRTGSLAAYRLATQAIGQLRNDLAGMDSVVQFSFRDRVEPVYREFVDQLLRGNPSQEDLQAARSAIEALQLVELENFFRQACLDAKPEPLDRAIDGRSDTAAVEAIVLSDRVATLTKLPGQPLRYAVVPVPRATVLQTLQRVQQAVQDPTIPNRERLRLSKQVYDWLVAPIAPELAQSGVKTLVFVLDGPLANIPIAALHDGEQYLLERYNTTRALGLQLFAPKALNPRSLNVLAAGVSEVAPSFQAEKLGALPFVADELDILAQELPAAVLRDQALTEQALRQALQQNNAPIVHVATHAQFSSRADRTFLLAWDRRIELADFDQLLRRPASRPPIELLVLSACETARGDDRATLGLTGIAIQAGTRSVLGTLWQVSDESTALLMGDFYQSLRTGATKAESLRQAQLALLKNPNFRHPFFWAPYILVGNWL